jgi:diguanylate cyclase (GGDEF)-like protein
MLTLTQCWFTRKHAPSERVPKSNKDVYYSHCKSCDRPIVSWDRTIWHLAEGFNLLNLFQGQDNSFLYLVDTRIDVVVSRFSINHLQTEQEIEAYARQIKADHGLDDLESVLELRDSRKGSVKRRKPARPKGSAPPGTAQVEEGQPPAADADRLTGLPGRGTFETVFATECAFASTRKSHLTVAFVDIDGLDAFNRAHGLDAGDALVRMVAEQLTGLGECKCHIARNRGLEFLLLLRGAGADLAHSRLENVRKFIARSKLPEAPEQPLSISCGLAEVPAGGDPRVSLRAADLALQHAKARKGSAVIVGDCGDAGAPATKTSWLGKRG